MAREPKGSEGAKAASAGSRRTERLAAALRQNLKLRKQQQRLRATAPDDPGPGAASTPERESEN